MPHVSEGGHPILDSSSVPSTLGCPILNILWTGIQNTAANILLAGTSPTRPLALSRGSCAVSTVTLATGAKSKSEISKDGDSNKLPVDAGR